MSRITRESFVDTLGAEGGKLDVNALDTQTSSALQRAGIDQTSLRQIAGEDGVISGNDEMAKLFDLVDTADRNGSYHSIDTTKRGPDGKEVTTASGALFAALQNEIDRSRTSFTTGAGGPASAPTGAPPPPPPPAAPPPASGPAVPTPPAAPERLPNPEYRPSQAAHARAVASLEAQGFTDIHLAKNTPYFNQADREWATHPYPKNPPEADSTRTLKQSGCAPVALAIADAALRGSGTTPIETADFAVNGKFSGKAGGFGSDAHGMGKAWAASHGLTYTPANDKDQSKNVDTLRDGLKNGGVAVISVGVDPATGEGHFTEKGHIMVVNGYAKDANGEEWFFIVNPGRRDQSKGPVLSVDDTVVQDKSLHNGAGQLRISRSQLEAEMKNGYVLNKSPE